MKYTFDAIIKKVPDQDGAYIEIPFDVQEKFGAKRVKVKAMFDSVLYRGSIVSMGGCYLIGVTKDIRNKLGKGPGETIKVNIEKDEDVREIILHEDFKKALDLNLTALEFFNTLSHSAKKKYSDWVSSAKKEETRVKRIHESIIKLESNEKL